jgi:hypothetical protein
MKTEGVFMGKDFVPLSDQTLPGWGRNLVAQILDDPARDGLTQPQAEALAGALGAYTAALAPVLDPQTRTRGAITAKEMVKKNFIAAVRQSARIIQANPATHHARRIELGLSVPRPRGRIAPPGAAPFLDVIGVDGRRIKLLLHDEVSRAARPAGVAEARIFSFSGEVLPGEESAWRFEAAPTRCRTQITAEAAVPGVRLWLRACWVNFRGQPGPMSPPISTSVQGVAGAGGAALRQAA